MSLLSHKHGSSPKIELKSKECIDLVLQPLKYHVTIKVNGSLRACLKIELDLTIRIGLIYLNQKIVALNR